MSIYQTNGLPPALFLDFEASSLSADSWPIEIGLTRVDEDGHLHTASKLIRPHESWDIEDWSQASAEIHNIPFDVLMNTGEDAEDVARWALEQTQSHVIISDAPEFEKRWYNKLLGSIGQFKLQIHHIDAYFGSTLLAPGLSVAYEHLSRTAVPHRAGPDSAIMAKAWVKGRKADAGEIPVRP